MYIYIISQDSHSSAHSINPFDEIRDSHFNESSRNSSVSIPARAIEDIMQLPDRYLPDLIGRAVMKNANALLALESSHREKAQIQDENKLLQTKQWQYENFQRQIQDLERESHSRREQVVK